MTSNPPVPGTSNDVDTNELMRRAIEFHKQGDLDEAVRLYQAVLALDAGHFDARHMLGTVELQRGNLDEALDLISTALQQQPDSFHALCDAGFACLLARRFD